jgi:hypothetical protein
MRENHTSTVMSLKPNMSTSIGLKPNMSTRL